MPNIIICDINAVKHKSLAYPRRCSECLRIYKSMTSFTNHKRKCSRFKNQLQNDKTAANAPKTNNLLQIAFNNVMQHDSIDKDNEEILIEELTNENEMQYDNSINKDNEEILIEELTNEDEMQHDDSMNKDSEEILIEELTNENEMQHDSINKDSDNILIEEEFITNENEISSNDIVNHGKTINDVQIIHADQETLDSVNGQTITLSYILKNCNDKSVLENIDLNDEQMYTAEVIDLSKSSINGSTNSIYPRLCQKCFRTYQCRGSFSFHKKKCVPPNFIIKHAKDNGITILRKSRRKAILRYECQHCKRKFRTKKHINAHEKYCQNPQANVYTCEQCSQRFAFLSTLNNHLNKVHGYNFMNELKFKTHNEFLLWLEEQEHQTCTKYVKATGCRTYEDRTVYYYNCVFNRYKDTSLDIIRKKNKTFLPVKKCNARMRVVDEGQNGVKVVYFSYHNHEISQNIIKYQHFQKSTVKYIVSALLTHTPISDIIEKVCLMHEPKNREMHLGKKNHRLLATIRYYRHQINVHGDIHKNKCPPNCIIKEVQDRNISDFVSNQMDEGIMNETASSTASHNLLHVEGMQIPDEHVWSINDYSWIVSDTKNDTQYVVRQIKEVCNDVDHCYFRCSEFPCANLCADLYTCECSDTNRLCEHIHKVHSLIIQTNGLSSFNVNLDSSESNTTVTFNINKKKNLCKYLMHELQSILDNSPLEDTILNVVSQNLTQLIYACKETENNLLQNIV